MGSVVITGASSGIGRACAELFARSGYNLILNARRIDRLESLTKDLQQYKMTAILLSKSGFTVYGAARRLEKMQDFKEAGAIITEWNRISMENLMKRSGNRVYKDLAAKHANMLAKGDRWGSRPVVIARVIKKTIESRNPRPRYAVCGGAKFVLFLRSVVPDKMLDRLFLSQLK